MNKRFAVLAAALALASPALAADTYQFDKSHTTVGFQVRHIFTMLGGKFQDFSGTIKVDRAKPESSSVEFTIQAATIFTNDTKRDEHLRNRQPADVARFPCHPLARESRFNLPEAGGHKCSRLGQVGAVRRKLRHLSTGSRRPVQHQSGKHHSENRSHTPSRLFSSHLTPRRSASRPAPQRSTPRSPAPPAGASPPRSTSRCRSPCRS